MHTLVYSDGPSVQTMRSEYIIYAMNDVVSYTVEVALDYWTECVAHREEELKIYVEHHFLIFDIVELLWERKREKY